MPHKPLHLLIEEVEAQLQATQKDKQDAYQYWTKQRQQKPKDPSLEEEKQEDLRLVAETEAQLQHQLSQLKNQLLNQQEKAFKIS